MVQARLDIWPASLQRDLIEAVTLQAPHMNVFGLHHVLWGLARIKADIRQPLHLQLREAGAATSISIGSKQEQQQKQLAPVLLAVTLEHMPRFLPGQVGDVIWALGALGYCVGPRGDLSPEQRRLLVSTISRIYGT